MVIAINKILKGFVLGFWFSLRFVVVVPLQIEQVQKMGLHPRDGHVATFTSSTSHIIILPSISVPMNSSLSMTVYPRGQALGRRGGGGREGALNVREEGGP